MYSPQLQSQIAEWRQKAVEGTLSTENLIAAVKLIREGRLSSAYSADAAKRKKAVAAIPVASDLLSELEGL